VLNAKVASTLDVLARSRYTFDIGAGWYEPIPHLGIDLPPVHWAHGPAAGGRANTATLTKQTCLFIIGS
jgi:hypothetical protein